MPGKIEHHVRGTPGLAKPGFNIGFIGFLFVLLMPHLNVRVLAAETLNQFLIDQTLLATGHHQPEVEYTGGVSQLIGCGG
jgi:hypothetical protein